MRLGKRYGAERLEAACRRALAIGACSYKSLESILKQGLDAQPVPPPPLGAPAVRHDNIRGSASYQPSLKEHPHVDTSDTYQTPDLAPEREVSRAERTAHHARDRHAEL